MGKNIVYFLGAGASKPFGYPLTNDVMLEILQRLFSSGKKPDAELLEFLFKLYPGLREIRSRDPEMQKRIPSITDILSIVDHFCFYNTPPHPEIADGTLVHFRDLLNRAVGELMDEYQRKGLGTQGKKLLEAFIAPIRAEKKENDVTLISTNYDLLIDSQFVDVALRNRIDYGIAYRDISTSELIFRHANPLFRYFKLHGSLSRLRCDLCGHYYINPMGSIVSLAFSEELNDANTCACSSKLRLKTVLVAPSLVRDIRDPNLLQIWKASLEAIRTADRLIMIGYSLPPEDLAIRSIIMRALNGRHPGRELEVDVVQFGEAAKYNYINLFGPNVNYYSQGLEHYQATVERSRDIAG